MWSSLRRSIFFHIGLAVLAVLVVRGVYALTTQGLALSRDLRARQQHIEELRNKKADLERRLSEAQLPAVVERVAKDRLNLKLPGEEVVVVPSENKDMHSSSTPSFIEKVKHALLLAP